MKLKPPTIMPHAAPAEAQFSLAVSVLCYFYGLVNKLSAGSEQ
jgi:hypothetical protein